MKAWLYIATTGVVFGIGGPASKYLIDQGLDPIFLTGVIFAISALAALPIHLRLGGAPRRAWLWALGLGAVNAIGPAMLFNLGFQRLPVSVNTVLISLGPIFTAVTAHFLAHDDRFSTRKAIGLTLGLLGVALLTGITGGGEISATGIVLTVTGALLQGVSFLGVKRLADEYRPLSTLAPMMIGAGLFGLVIVAATNSWASPDGTQWLLMAVLGVSGTLAFGAILAANEIAPASQTALFAYVIPVMGVMAGVLFFRERFGWRLALGAALVMTGLVLVGQQRPESSESEQSLGPDRLIST